MHLKMWFVSFTASGTLRTSEAICGGSERGEEGRRGVRVGMRLRIIESDPHATIPACHHLDESDQQHQLVRVEHPVQFPVLGAAVVLVRFQTCVGGTGREKGGGEEWSHFQGRAR